MIKMNPTKPMTVYDIPGVVKTSFPAAITTKNIQSVFEITGIWPLNPDVFKKIFLVRL